MNSVFYHVWCMAEHAWLAEEIHTRAEETGTEVDLARALGTCSADAYEAVEGLRELQAFIKAAATGKPPEFSKDRWYEKYAGDNAADWEGSQAKENKAFDLLGAYGRFTSKTMEPVQDKQWRLSDLERKDTEDLVARLLRRCMEVYKITSEIYENIGDSLPENSD